MLKVIAAQILPAALFAAAAVLVLPAAVADQNSAKDQNGDPCLKINCEGGTIENHCDRPVNFAACHAESRSGCLLNIKSGAQIAPKESLPFACKPGNLAQADGCFPPFVPVSFSALQSGCIPDPENPDALTAAAAASTAPQSAPVPQAPQAAPKPDPAAKAPAPAPKPECEMDSLLQAAGKNNIAAARCLIESGADVNAKNNHGWTPMDLAIHWGHAEMQSLLSRHGGKAARFAQAPEPESEGPLAAPPPAGTPTENTLRKCNAWPGQLSANATANTEGNKTVFHKDWECKWLHTYTHLLIAARMNDSNSARWLIANGAEVNAKNNRGFTPLHLAAIYNAPETAALLLKNGADVNAKNNNGWTPLHLANHWGHAEMQSLLSRHGGKAARFAQAPEPESEGPLAAPPPSGTPTENALRKCNAWDGQLSANATANTEGNETVFHKDWKCERLHTETHLHTAARMNDSNSALWLIANGANVHAKDEVGVTPLRLAAQENATETAALLLKNGADVHAKNKDGDTPLHYAALKNATETAALLLKNGADVNAKNNSDWTPLHYAAYSNATETAALLLKNGAEVNAKKEDGWTPLHYAAFYNATETAALLLKNGADVNAKGNNDWTPLDWAIFKEHSEMQSLLKRHGGRCNRRC